MAQEKSDEIRHFLKLETHEAKTLHRIHNKLKKEIDEEQQELKLSDNLFEIVERVEQMIVDSEQLTRRVYQLQTKKEILAKDTRLNKQVELGRQISEIAAELQKNGTLLESKLKGIRETMKYIERISNALKSEHISSKRIDRKITKWSKSVMRKVTESEKKLYKFLS